MWLDHYFSKACTLSELMNGGKDNKALIVYFNESVERIVLILVKLNFLSNPL